MCFDHLLHHVSQSSSTLFSLQHLAIDRYLSVQSLFGVHQHLQFDLKNGYSYSLIDAVDKCNNNACGAKHSKRELFIKPPAGWVKKKGIALMNNFDSKRIPAKAESSKAYCFHQKRNIP